MKANQAFKANDEAVSPVIGVILMVAITVVLAAVVFVLVSNLSESNDSAPILGITSDDNQSRLTINTAPNSLNYAQFKIKSDQPVSFTRNAAPTIAAGREVGCTPATATCFGSSGDAGANTDVVSGGDFFSFCATNAAGTGPTAGTPPAAATGVTIQLLHVATNTQVYTHTFPSIASCA